MTGVRFLIWRGFRFGMLLQLAVGPMCILVLQTSVKQGFLPGMSLVSGIALMDACYIMLSGAGIAAVLKGEKARRWMKYAGGLVLAVFGMYMTIRSFFPEGVSHAQTAGSDLWKLFAEGVLLTASNPLTIVFWGGVFSAQTAEHAYGKKELALFGSGCVLSTLVFLSLMAAAGAGVGVVLPGWVLQAANIAVGLVLVYFGVRLMVVRAES